MNINNYMSVKEAAYRWGVKVPAIREKLNIKRRPALQDDLDRGLVKYFKPDESSYGEWIISKRAMEEWYGPEPNSREDKYDKFIRLLQSKVGLNDDLTKKLLEHFSPEFIVNIVFEVYEKRLKRQKSDMLMVRNHSHSVQIPNHSHNFQLPDHKHSMNELVEIPTASEELEFEIFKKKVELDIAMDISEEEAEMIFDGDYADFYPEMGLRGTKGLVYIKKPFSNEVLEQMKELASKCQLSITNSKEELEKYLEY